MKKGTKKSQEILKKKSTKITSLAYSTIISLVSFFAFMNIGLCNTTMSGIASAQYQDIDGVGHSMTVKSVGNFFQQVYAGTTITTRDQPFDVRGGIDFNSTVDKGYLYIYGYANFVMSGLFLTNGVCENISASAFQNWNPNEDYMYPSKYPLIPFAFKCQINSSTKSITFRAFGMSSGYTSNDGTAQNGVLPNVYWYKQIGTLENVTSEAENQMIEQNKQIIEQNKQMLQAQNKQLEEQQKQHDELMNSDIPAEDKETPDDSKYQDYSKSEKELLDKTKNVDIESLSIGIDANSSKWVWETLTSLIQSHTAVFGMFIAILTIGIIKLALGR